MKLYIKRFGREPPETIRSIEEAAAAKQAKKQAKKAARAVASQPSGQDAAGENAIQAGGEEKEAVAKRVVSAGDVLSQ